MFSLQQIYGIYDQFLSNFPAKFHGMVSLALAVLLVYGIYKVLRKHFIYVVLLVILLPASVPILRSVWGQTLELLKFLVSRRG